MTYKSWQLITQGCLLSGAIKTGLSKYSTVKKSNCDEHGSKTVESYQFKVVPVVGFQKWVLFFITDRTIRLKKLSK